jgi:apolipoprotein D and lipocalin family protein
MKNSIVSGLLVILLAGCKSTHMLETVSQLDLKQYQGTWYEIARLPNSFEGDLTSVTATYTLLESGKVEVLNQGYKANGKLKSIKGKAWVPSTNYPGRLKVRFFWPFSGDYYVIKIDDSYQVALVGSPSRKFLWILAKHPVLPKEKYDQYVQAASEYNFNIKELISVDQSLHIDDKN